MRTKDKWNSSSGHGKVNTAGNPREKRENVECSKQGNRNAYLAQNETRAEWSNDKNSWLNGKKTRIKKRTAIPSDCNVCFARKPTCSRCSILPFSRTWCWLDGCGLCRVCIFSIPDCRTLSRGKIAGPMTSAKRPNERNESEFNPLWSVTAPRCSRVSRWAGSAPLFFFCFFLLRTESNSGVAGTYLDKFLVS